MARLETETLSPRPTSDSSESDLKEPAVQTYLKVMRDFESQKAVHDNKVRVLRDFVDQGFTVESGTTKVNAKKLYQAVWEVMKRARILDGAVHGAGRPENAEKLIRDGINTIKENAGYVEMYTNKNGLFMEGFAYGDAFGLFDIKKDGIPFRFRNWDMTGIYVDNYATSIRHGSQPARRVVLVGEMGWDEFVDQYPDYEDKVNAGDLPYNDETQLHSQTEEQDYEREQRVQIGIGFDIVNKNYTVFAGSNAKIIHEKNDKDYPYVFNNREGLKEPYIPVVHFSCMPSYKGFFNHGIFDTFYDIAVVYQSLLNAQISSVGENTNPDRFVVVNDAGKFMENLAEARRMRAAGGNPYVPLELGEDGTAPAVGVRTLQVQNLTNDLEALFARLDNELKRFGINIDALEGGGQLATEIIADEENANRFVKQVMEMHASEVQFIHDVIIDQIPKVISDTDDTILRMTTRVRLENGAEVDLSGQVTLGMVALELKDNYYFYKVNRRSGVDLSKLRLAQVARGLEVMPESMELRRQFLELNDIEFEGPQPQAAGQALEQPEADQLAATEPQRISSGRGQVQPAI